VHFCGKMQTIFIVIDLKLNHTLWFCNCWCILETLWMHSSFNKFTVLNCEMKLQEWTRRISTFSRLDAKSLKDLKLKTLMEHTITLYIHIQVSHIKCKKKLFSAEQVSRGLFKLQTYLRRGLIVRIKCAALSPFGMRASERSAHAARPAGTTFLHRTH